MTKIEKKTQDAVTVVMQKLINVVNKAYDAPIMSMAEDIELKRVRTGIFSIDYATQGGLPCGRWFIVVGKESVFKSTLLYIGGGKTQRVCGNCLSGNIVESGYHSVVIKLSEKTTDTVKLTKDGYESKVYLANSKRNNIYVPGQPIKHKKDIKAYQYKLSCTNCDDPDYSIFLLIDSENNYTQYWGIKCGIVHARMILVKTRYSEQVGDIIKEVLSTGRCTYVGVDSVPAAPPKIEDESSFEDQQMGIQPKLWNKIVRVLTAKLNTTFTYIYKKGGKEIVEVKRPEPILGMVQQWRDKIGAYGDPKTMTAGYGLKYASSVTIDLSIGEKEYIGEKTDKNVRGLWFNFVLIKSKTSKPFAHGRFFFNLDTLSVENNISIVEKAIDKGLIDSAGAWYYIGDSKYQGKAKLMEAIKTRIPALGEKLLEMNAET